MENFIENEGVEYPIPAVEQVEQEVEQQEAETTQEVGQQSEETDEQKIEQLTLEEKKEEDIVFLDNQFTVSTSKGTLFTSEIVIGAFGKRSIIDQKLNRDFIHENLHLLDVADEIDEHILKEVFPLLNEAHWENIYQIRSLIDLFIKKGRIELISLFLKIEIKLRK